MKNFNGLFCEKLLVSVKKGKKKKKDRNPTISAVTNIHTRFYIQIHEYPSTRILAAALILAQNDDGPLKWANGPYPIQISKF